MKKKGSEVELYKKLNRTSKGSITVEATFIFPLFLSVMGLFIFLFQVFFIQTRMDSAIDLTGRKCAIYWYGVEAVQDYALQDNSQPKEEQENNIKTILSKIGTELLRDGITTLYVRNETLKQYGEHFNWIKNGKKGISFLGSGISEGGTVLKIVVTYEIKIPFVSGATFKCVQSCWKRLWTGEEYERIQEDSEEEQYVYTTKNGTVYHTTINCSYLKRTISTVKQSDILNIQNKQGEIYTRCGICCDKEEKQEIYYVTTTGNRYHITLECSALSRYIEKRLFSDVKGLKGCSRCAQA